MLINYIGARDGNFVVGMVVYEGVLILGFEIATVVAFCDLIVLPLLVGCMCFA